MGIVRKLVLSLSVMAVAMSACGGAPTGGNTSTTASATSAPAATAVPAATSATAATAAPTKPAATVAPAATPTAAEAPVSGSARDAVLAALRKQLTVGPYRSKSTITSNKVNMNIVGEVIPPDRMHVTSTVNGRSTEQIYVGGKGWSRTAAGAWSPMATTLITTVMQQINGAALADLENIITNVKSAGADTVDGAKALVYTYVSDMSKAAMPLDVTSNAKIWVNETTGLIVKNEIVGTVAGVTSKTVQTVEYDPSITIEPPK